MNKVLITFSLATVLLSGCGGSEDNSDNNSSDNNGVVNSPKLEGLWDSTKNMGVNSDGEFNYTDTKYKFISGDGIVTLYDFLGDSFDKGEDCYTQQVTGTLSTINNTKYLYKNADASATDQELDIQVTNDVLIVTNESGETYENPRSNLEISDFTPLCSTNSDT